MCYIIWFIPPFVGNLVSQQPNCFHASISFVIVFLFADERAMPHEWQSCGDEAEGWSPSSQGSPMTKCASPETAEQQCRCRPSLQRAEARPGYLVASPSTGTLARWCIICSHARRSTMKLVEHPSRGGIVYPRLDDSMFFCIPGSIMLVRFAPHSHRCQGGSVVPTLTHW